MMINIIVWIIFIFNIITTIACGYKVFAEKEAIDRVSSGIALVIYACTCSIIWQVI